MTTILDRIVETKRKELPAARKAVSLDTLIAYAEAAGSPRDCYEAVPHPSPGGAHLVAEVLGTDGVRQSAELAHDLGMTALIEVRRSALLAAIMAAVDFDPAWRPAP